MLTLNNLKSPGAHRNTKRLGRGQGSGRGTQAGKGHKGQKARSGGGVRVGFEGGALPLYMRLPKRGFSNSPFRKEYATISLDKLNKSNLEEVSREILVKEGLLKGTKKSMNIKILGVGKLEKGLKFSSEIEFSKSAREAVEKAGGQIEPKAPKAEKKNKSKGE